MEIFYNDLKENMEKRGTMQQGEAFITTRCEQETEYIGAMIGKYLQRP